MPRLTALCLLLGIVACTTPGEPARQRHATTHTLVSQRDPAVRIALPPKAVYVGTDRWVLYGVADCEIHVFVEATPDKRIQRLYWIQFEQYLPSKPELHYDYDRDPQRLSKDGMLFHVRPRFGPTNEPAKPDSDLDHVLKLLVANGYTNPPHMMNTRLVHLTDATRRKELMVIYSVDMAPTGLTSQDLMRDGDIDEARWAPIAQALVAEADRNIRITRLR